MLMHLEQEFGSTAWKETRSTLHESATCQDPADRCSKTFAKLLMKLTTLSLFCIVTASVTKSYPGKPSLTCVLTRCGGRASGCKADKNCSKAINCNNNCPLGTSRPDCSVRCAVEYGNEPFDDLTACIQKHGCVAPYEKIVYPIPDCIAELQDLRGIWYPSAGLDKVLLTR
jgi:hypothetical protein